LAENKYITPGDSELDKTSLSKYFNTAVPFTEKEAAFVNVAVLLVFKESGRDIPCSYFIQPKLFPYEGERSPGIGTFMRGRVTHVLNMGGTKVITSICYDLIAQPNGFGPMLIDVLKEVDREYEAPDYLLLPQCNRGPLNTNFQHAVANLYCSDEYKRQTLRTISPNVAYVDMEGKRSEAGQSWFVTSPFKNALPDIGIWERTLPSEFYDTTRKEAVRDAHSLGPYAHRLRLAAKGEWLLNISLPPAHHLAELTTPINPLRPHDGMIYEWSDDAWRKKDRAIFVRQCRHADRLPGLLVMADLPGWVQKNIGGRDSYSPTYDEFTNQRVYLPENYKDQTMSLLNAGKDVWVRGKRACGKTVFGLGIGFIWISEKSGRSLFIDLKDLDHEERQLIDLAKKDIDWFVDETQSPCLVVIDNVHTEESTALELVGYIQDQRRYGSQVQALLLGRYSQESPTERRKLQDINDVVPVDIEADSEAFKCVAMRLLERGGAKTDVNPSHPPKWVRECGGDLVVFACAFDVSDPEGLNKASIFHQVRERYLRPAERQPGGKNAFIDLCVLGSIDLNAEDSVIWDNGAATSFPEFIQNGTVSRVLPARTGDQREYCRLFHPSLGELVFRVYCYDSNEDTGQLWLKQSLDLCRCHPFLLSLIHYRLATGDYTSVVDFEQWCKALNNQEDLIEQAICHSPFRAMSMLRRGEIAWDWKHLRGIDNSEKCGLLLQRLAQTPANLIVQFLRYLDRQELKTERKVLLKALLKEGIFKASLAQTQAALIVKFLEYLDNQVDDEELRGESKKVLETLLDDETFNKRLVDTQADLITMFLEYVGRTELRVEVKRILKALPTDKTFKKRLAKTHAHFIVRFLRYMDMQGLKGEREGLVKFLLEDETFKAKFGQTQADIIVEFLEYLDDQDLRGKSKEVLEAVLKNEAFNKRLVNTPPDLTTKFLKYVGRTELREEGKRILIALLELDKFADVFYASPPDAQGTMLRYLAEIGYGERAQVLLDKIYGQMETQALEDQFIHWPRHTIAGFNKAIFDGKINMPEAIWRKLHEMAIGPSHAVPVPDSEFTQEVLLSMTVNELAKLLESYDRPHDKYKMYCIVKSLISDERKLKQWITGLSNDEKLIFREIVDKRRFKVPESTWELLSAYNR